MLRKMNHKKSCTHMMRHELNVLVTMRFKICNIQIAIKSNQQTAFGT